MKGIWEIKVVALNYTHPVLQRLPILFHTGITIRALRLIFTHSLTFA